MFIIIDSSVLIAASILWKYNHTNGVWRLVGKAHHESDSLLNFIKKSDEITCIISKTVENEAKNTLREKAINNVIQFYEKEKMFPDFIIKKYKSFVLQNIILNASIDRLEMLVEEYSTRLPIDISIRDKLMNSKLIPFFDKVIPETCPFIPAPHIPRTIKGSLNAKKDILNSMIKGSDKGYIIYKGYPEPKDIIIMSEALYIYNNHCKDTKKDLLIASLDNHFKPNPVFIGSRDSSFWRKKNTDPIRIDSTVRDRLKEEFGFECDHPKAILDKIQNN